LGHVHFKGLLICRRQVGQGSGGSQSGPAVMRRTSGNIEAMAFSKLPCFFAAGARGLKEDATSSPDLRRTFPFAGTRSLKQVRLLY
jgi:hypothetical protein